MIQVQQESLSQIRASGELDALLREHWQEIALYRDRIPLEPDWQRYAQLEESGALVCLSARDDGKLVGYCGWVMAGHLHYASCRVAANDVIFVRREHRSGSTAGVRLIRESERILAEAGVHRMTWHVKPENDWSAILMRMGYAREEIVMGRLLERT